MTTDTEFERRLNQRDSASNFAEIHNRINGLAADGAMLKKYVETLHSEVRDIRTQTISTQTWVEDNSKVTREVKEILMSFKTVGHFAKWITTVAASVAVVFGIVHGWFK